MTTKLNSKKMEESWISHLKNNVNYIKIRDFSKSASEKIYRLGLFAVKAVYLLQFIPRLFCLTIFSGYDTKCAIYENASIFDCKQEFYVSSPKQWILYWLVLSIISSICLCSLCGLRKKTRKQKIFRNMGFWVMIILFLPASGSFVIRIFNTDSTDMALTAVLFIWWPATVGQIIYLDNHIPANYPQTNPRSAEAERDTIHYNPRNCQDQEDTIWFYIVYNLSLAIHCMECVAFAGAITLDATMALFPVAVIHGDIHGTLIINLSKISLGIRALFVYGISLLYFQKIFHGDRTLFSKPGEPLHEVEEHAN